MINDLLNQDCFIIKTVRDSYGDYIQGDPIHTDCRTSEKFENVKNKAGEEVVSSLRFWLPKDVDINEKNLTDTLIRYHDKDYSIISMQNRIDLMGETLFKVVYV
ncbi:hypothetical protein [Virgibacillus sp. SK37]|uniref:hypothetical protein n=1 Tax=Virgibacillus sp. SK37 TaxID=403957 RepID=UPI0004D194FE|nr:hypothetical protein [Virgibacillus sp. SK37]AIF45429.1 hypothetical protein X953_10150 [Virgibacillus sp. SK37]